MKNRDEKVHRLLEQLRIVAASGVFRAALILSMKGRCRGVFADEDDPFTELSQCLADKGEPLGFIEVLPESQGFECRATPLPEKVGDQITRIVLEIICIEIKRREIIKHGGNPGAEMAIFRVDPDKREDPTAGGMQPTRMCAD
jgi:hypothetical protein